MMNSGYSLEHTPTWAVSVVCFFIFLISFIVDAGLHYLTQFFRRRKRKSLNRALVKIKTEMMIMGFISVLLTLSEAPISKICVTEALANSFLPCKDPFEFTEPAASSAVPNSGSESESNQTLPSADVEETYCKEKGKVSLISREGVMQLNIFTSVLAIVHVIYCALTMCLGMAKMKRWEAWEEETRTLAYQIANDPRRFRLTHQTSFGRRHLKFWSNHALLLWPVCFIRQFSSSASKADYFTLRDAFIMANVAEGSNFNFQKLLGRAVDEDFEQVVKIRFWVWIFSILFILFSADGFYNYYWLPFIPLVIILVVGTKLQIIITKMCAESCKNNSVIRGNFLLKPSNDLFWFGRPKWLLYLFQLVLIQNSFQLAFFTWSWYEYGLRSCFNHETEGIAIRISMGLIVQFLCGYRTLPLYALVTQMGSGMHRAVFTDQITKGLKNWRHIARASLYSGRCNSTRNSSGSSPADKHPPGSEVTEEEHAPDEASPKIVNRGAYVGEISFGCSWRKSESTGIGVGDIVSAVEEDSSNLSIDFDVEKHTHHTT